MRRALVRGENRGHRSFGIAMCGMRMCGPAVAVLADAIVPSPCGWANPPIETAFDLPLAARRADCSGIAAGVQTKGIAGARPTSEARDRHDGAGTRSLRRMLWTGGCVWDLALGGAETCGSGKARNLEPQMHTDAHGWAGIVAGVGRTLCTDSGSRSTKRSLGHRKMRRWGDGWRRGDGEEDAAPHRLAGGKMRRW
jgi:hypothetical protein